MKRKSLTSIGEIEDVLKVHKRELKEKYGVKKIGIFGSYIRRENTKNSLKPFIGQRILEEIRYV